MKKPSGWVRFLADAGLSLLMLVVVVLALAEAADWPFRSRYFVQFISLPLSALLAAQIVLSVRHVMGRGRPPSTTMDLSFGGDLPADVVMWRALGFTLWLLALVAAIWMVGFIAGGLVIVALYMRLAAGEKFWVVATMLVVLGATLFVAREVLNVPLPGGWVWGALLS